MNKPKWVKAPLWAQWLAQDEDGQWVWWEEKPEITNELFWMPKPASVSLYGRASSVDLKRHPEWRTTLEQRCGD